MVMRSPRRASPDFPVSPTPYSLLNLEAAAAVAKGLEELQGSKIEYCVELLR